MVEELRLCRCDEQMPELEGGGNEHMSTSILNIISLYFLIKSQTFTIREIKLFR